MVNMSILFTDRRTPRRRTPYFVNRQKIRLIQFSCNCAFLDKEELCKKLAVLQLFYTQ